MAIKKISSSTQSASFSESVEAALNRFPDAAYLGEHSPLASPYLLRDYFDGDQVSAEARGKALQKVLREALARMDYDEAALHRRIIEERFFKGNKAVYVQQLDGVNLGKTQYFTHQKRAVIRFESYVLDALNPAIRLERPLVEAEGLLDRNAQIRRCEACLAEGQTVVLAGPSGIGKTSLGSHIANRWPEDVFWFTVRPGLNDHLDSFLFDFAFFCHQQGASALWQEIVTKTKGLVLTELLGVLRLTVENLPTRPLICVDEADALTPPTNGSHAQIAQLLTFLRGKLPILMMGKNESIGADRYERLNGFPASVANTFLKQAQVGIGERSLQQLMSYTSGNPRLLGLFAVLHQSGEQIDALLTELQNSPAIPFLLGRTLRRIPEIEVQLLMDVGIFDTPAPADAWEHKPELARALASLQQKHLLQRDTQGAIFLLPAYRETLFLNIPHEKRSDLHRKAGEILQQRAQYTLAAYHFSRTDSPEVAVWMWRGVQQQEINAGQGYIALQLFRSMEAMPLSVAAKEQVKIFCATLENLVGSPAKAQEDLRSVLWQTPLLQLEAKELGGVIASDQSRFDEAELFFQQAISIAEKLIELRLSRIYKGLGWRYLSERELEQAWQLTSLAEYEVENMQSTIQLARCKYLDAVDRFKRTLKLARQLQHSAGIAKTCSYLGEIHTVLGRFKEAEEFYAEAEMTYKKIGRQAATIGMKIHQTFMYNIAGQHKQALDVIKKLEKDAEHSGGDISPMMSALISQNAAEALLGLGQFEQAEGYIQQAIDQEEITVLPDSLRSFGEIRLRQGQLDEAKLMVQQSIDLIEQNEEPDLYLLGYAYRALAKVFIAQDDTNSADEAQAQAIDLFSQINLPNEVEKTHRELNAERQQN